MTDDTYNSWLLKVARIQQHAVENPHTFTSLDAYCEEMDEIDRKLDSPELGQPAPRRDFSR